MPALSDESLVELSHGAFAKYFADLAFQRDESAPAEIVQSKLVDPVRMTDSDKPSAASAERCRPSATMSSSSAVAVETWTGGSSFDSCFVDVVCRSIAVVFLPCHDCCCSEPVVVADDARPMVASDFCYHRSASAEAAD